MATNSLLDKFESAYSALQAPLDEEEIDDLPSDFPTQRSKVTGGSKFNRLYALSRAPPGPHMTVTNSNGTRVYLRMKSNQPRQQQKKKLFSQFHLLPVPISDLREAVEEEASVLLSVFL